MNHLIDFLTESLSMEGITRGPLLPELESIERFIKLRTLSVADLTAVVKVYRPNAVLRDRVGMNVVTGPVGTPPRGGPQVVKKLLTILDTAIGTDPYQLYLDYQALHPYSDGNGLSGRAVWLWQRVQDGHACPKSFLRMFYYQALAHRGAETALGGPKK